MTIFVRKLYAMFVQIKNILFFILLLGFSYQGVAQLAVDAEFRPRFEYRHGYKDLIPKGENPAAFVSQRSRLNVDLLQSHYRFYMSIQDVRVWGDLPQLSRHDANGLGLHQIWAELDLTKYSRLKIGRQELTLDDARIFGNVDWAQQARSHDLVLYNWEKGSWTIKAAVAFNQEDELLAGNDYYLQGNYKTLQLLWLHKKWENISLSILGLNNGMQYIDTVKRNGVYFSQTLGYHFERTAESSLLAVKSYYQMGKNQSGELLDAYLIGVDYTKDLKSNLSIGFGGELISGNSNGVVKGNTNRAFEPLYATAHKFNGYMDYFYGGYHNNSVGLIDLNLSIMYDIGDKSDILLKGHQFLVPSKIDDNEFKKLGTEIDLVFLRKINKEISFLVGYSQVLPQKTLKDLRGVQATQINNFGYISLLIRPNLLKMKLTNN